MEEKRKIYYLISAFIIGIVLTFGITYSVLTSKANSEINFINNEKANLIRLQDESNANIMQLQNNLEKDDAFINNIRNYELYNSFYVKERDRLYENISKINITLDYTTCMIWIDRLKEQKELFNSNELETFNYFTGIADFVNKSSCYDKLNDYDNNRKASSDARESNILVQEKWCYGWHKVEWSPTWAETYGTSASWNNLTATEANTTEAYYSFFNTCYS